MRRYKTKGVGFLKVIGQVCQHVLYAILLDNVVGLEVDLCIHLERLQASEATHLIKHALAIVLGAAGHNEKRGAVYGGMRTSGDEIGAPVNSAPRMMIRKTSGLALTSRRNSPRSR